MLNDDQVRRLLQRAADTVVVQDVAATRMPERRRRPAPFIAGAAAAVVVIAAFVGVQLAHRPTTAPPSPKPTGIVLPEVDRYTLAPGRIPLLFGQTVASATKELRKAGWTVRVEHDVRVCQPYDRVWDTLPSVGTALPRGHRVTILAARAAADCSLGDMSEPAWSLMDLAFGRGGTSALAPRVNLWLGDRFHRTLERADAADPDAWVVCSDNGVVCASALREIEAAAYVTVNADPRLPRATVAPADILGCVGQMKLPDALAGASGSARKLRIDIPMDGIFCQPGPVFATDSTGQITDVVVWDGLNDDGTAGRPVPDVVGMQGREAAERLTNDGFSTPKVERVDDCRDIGAVQTQTPTAGSLAAVGVPTTIGVCGTSDISPDADGVGAAFLSFVSGAKAPPFADHVGLWLGNVKVTSVPGPDLESSDSAAWTICPTGGGYAGAACPFSAISTIRRSMWPPHVPDVGHPVLGPCAAGARDADLPSERFVVIDVAEPDSCANNWDVELYYDSHDRITDVNLLLGAR